jgi:hypothetical protein
MILQVAPVLVHSWFGVLGSGIPGILYGIGVYGSSKKLSVLLPRTYLTYLSSS